MFNGIRVVLLALVVSCGLVACHRGEKGEKPEAKGESGKPPEEEPSRIAHDDAGRVVVKLDDQTRDKLGLAVAKLASAEQSPAVSAYGRVLDPAPLAALVTELASAQAAALASSNELARLQMLVKQQNTSQRNLQTAEASARRDALAVQSTQDKLVLEWGPQMADSTNLPAVLQPLMLREAVLIRVDLPTGQSLGAAPKGAVVTSLSGKTGSAAYFGASSRVEPQTLGRGALFEMQPNALGLMFGEAVTARVELPGTAEQGVLVPANAVVRSAGRGWVYVSNASKGAFTRTEIPLERALPEGWFVPDGAGLSSSNEVVITGAQALLSEEMKGSLKSD